MREQAKKSQTTIGLRGKSIPEKRLAPGNAGVATARILTNIGRSDKFGAEIVRGLLALATGV
jgi:hypothetical protein